MKNSQKFCGGTFGNPIFNETFESVSTPNQTISVALLPPAFTTYSYSSIFPPNDGSYTISNSTEYTSWGWQKSLDHTKDAIGTYGNNNLHRRGDNVISPNVTFQIKSVSSAILGTKTTRDLPKENGDFCERCLLIK